MKKIIVCSIAFFLLGCLPAKHVIPDKEIPNDVWNELSQDLSNIYALVETINKNLETNRTELKVEVENQEYPIDKNISLLTASEIKKYPIIKIGKAKIPTVKGLVYSDIFKTRIKAGTVWFAAERKHSYKDIFAGWANPEGITLGNKNIPLYAYGSLNDKTKAIPAIKQLVIFDGFIDKAFREVSEALKYVQKKYKDSPIYIEGFQVHIGINFSVDIMFKIKR